ncbi:hypothetical protein [Adlercreutzia equolifaciens]|uniref:hypothetical protein n=1 Tax=Adlercreutzia equolifaciens TaxID=446660 RepID=UPI002673B301|nr:hypothetical protein [Adlercreutzia equolifaciens]
MEISIKSLYEPLDIDIDTGRGTVRVAAEVDVTPTNLARLAKVCTAAQNKMGAIEALMSKGRETNSIAKIAEANAKTGAVLREVLTEAIGADSYDELLHAVGGGHEVSDADCTPVTAQVFREVLEIVKSRNEQMDEKAAHYLPEESHAQTEPDPAA